MQPDLIKADHLDHVTLRPHRTFTTRFLVILALGVVFHAALILLMLTYGFVPVQPEPDPISVEIIEEPPPPEQKQTEEKPPEPDLAEKQPDPPKPPEPQQRLDEKPASDAPRAATEDRDMPDAGEAEKTPVAEKQPDAAPKPPEEEPTREKLVSEAPDTIVPKRPKTIAEQVAALKPLPDFEFETPAKRSPYASGSESPRYMSMLYGAIMQVMRRPPEVAGTRQGEVVFTVDGRGRPSNIMVIASSGSPALDAAAKSAVVRAAPLPIPPNGGPISVRFTYSVR